MTTRLQAASEALAQRLTVWKKLARYHAECEDTGAWIDRRDMWSQADEDALNEYEDAKAEAMGQRPLPFSA